jgi:transcriptional regulator with XRE-family HTH domain
MLAFFANLAHQQKSLTQEQLAERSGFSQQYLSCACRKQHPR